MDEEEQELDEQEKKRIEKEQKKQQEIDESNKTAHTVGSAVATYYGGQKGAKIYNAVSKTKVGQAAEKRLGKEIRKNPMANHMSKKLNRSGALDTINSAMGSANTSESANHTTNSSYEPTDKADVKIKLPKLSIPVIIILLILGPVIFFSIFISVLLPGMDFFDDDATSSSGSGLETTENDNYYARTSRATRENSYYYDQSSGLAINGLEGECAWYGLCRAQEILATSGSSKKFSQGGNGGQFCEVAEGLPDNFTIVRDYQKPKAGSLIVWKGGTNDYGHVAVIEKVIDENTVFISEASIGNGQFGSTAKELLWTSGSQYQQAINKYGSNAAARKANCEGNDSGCQSFKTISISSLKNYSGLSFACYVYLLDE